MKRTEFLCILLTLWLLFQFRNVASRTCAFFPNYPPISTVNYANCSSESECYSGYATNSSDACVAATIGIWWICFIVILAVALLIFAIVIIYCLVKKTKEADQQYLLSKQQFEDMMATQQIDEEEEDNEPKYTVQINTSQQIEDEFDFNKTPNYLSFFQQQPETINLDFNDDNGISKPSLPATIQQPKVDKDIFNMKPGKVNNPRSLSPLDVYLTKTNK